MVVCSCSCSCPRPAGDPAAGRQAAMEVEMESQLPSSSRSYFRRRWRRLQIAWGRILIILHCFDSNACCSLAGLFGLGQGEALGCSCNWTWTHRSVTPLANASQAFHPFGFGFWPERRLSPTRAVWDVIKSSGLIDKHWLFFGHPLCASCLFDFWQVR